MQIDVILPDLSNLTENYDETGNFNNTIRNTFDREDRNTSREKAVNP